MASHQGKSVSFSSLSIRLISPDPTPQLLFMVELQGKSVSFSSLGIRLLTSGFLLIPTPQLLLFMVGLQGKSVSFFSPGIRLLTYGFLLIQLPSWFQTRYLLQPGFWPRGPMLEQELC